MIWEKIGIKIHSLSLHALESLNIKSRKVIYCHLPLAESQKSEGRKLKLDPSVGSVQIGLE